MNNFNLKYPAVFFVPLVFNILPITVIHAATQQADGEHAIHWGYTMLVSE